MSTHISTKHCLKCGSNTDHTLKRTFEGVDWACDVCNNTQQGFTFGEMYHVIMKNVFKVPEKPENVEVPKDIRVFIKHQGSEKGEGEVERAVIETHTEIMGALPGVGKPLFTKVDGVPVPFGEVLRIELADD